MLRNLEISVEISKVIKCKIGYYRQDKLNKQSIIDDYSFNLFFTITVNFKEINSGS